MFRSRTLIGLLVGATLLLSACTSGAGAYPAATAAPAASSAAGVTVSAATVGSLGTILIGPDGRTLYIHSGDSMNASTCAGACIATWPPLTAAAGQQVTAGPGVTGTLGSFVRSDGSQWITYAGMPLYYWQGDTKPGDATGQGLEGFVAATVSDTNAAPDVDASQPPKSDYSY